MTPTGPKTRVNPNVSPEALKRARKDIARQQRVAERNAKLGPEKVQELLNAAKAKRALKGLKLSALPASATYEHKPKLQR